MSLPGMSRRCMRAAGAAVNYIARIAGITSIIRIKINVQASDVLPCGATKGRGHRSRLRPNDLVPLLLGLARDCGRGWVLDLDPAVGVLSGSGPA
jgi:hypothetical protein